MITDFTKAVVLIEPEFACICGDYGTCPHGWDNGDGCYTCSTVADEDCPQHGEDAGA